jgi:predicted amidohydrolase
MRVAVAQFSVSKDKAENRQRIGRLAEDAARGGARLAVVPELALVAHALEVSVWLLPRHGRICRLHSTW